MTSKLLLSLLTMAALTGCAGLRDTADKFSEVNGNLSRLAESHKRELARLEENHKREISRLEQTHANLDLEHKNDVAKLNVGVKEATVLAKSKFAYVEAPGVTHIQFGSGSAKLSEADEKVLAVLAKNLLRENKNVHLELKGQADNFGTERQNKELAVMRAEAVRTVLNQNGVVLNRMALIALPAVSKGAVSQTAEDHARNRRVSIAVVE